MKAREFPLRRARGGTKGRENVSTMFDTPVLTVADDSVLLARRRRRDRRRPHPYRPASLRDADGYPGKKFWGEVVRVGRLLGGKNLRTDEPAEGVDTKILETLIELQNARELLVGLRVDASILFE